MISIYTKRLHLRNVSQNEVQRTIDKFEIWRSK